MKIVIAPDKFKGSLTSFQVCGSIAAGIKMVNSSIEIAQFPMADGGDGFAAVMKQYLHTETVSCPAVDPLGRPIATSYEQKDDVVLIELASASGLVLLKDEERDPLKTSTYGSGRMIKQAIEKGAKKIILGLGGSATNDAGTGILEALGFRLEDKDGATLKANGENLLNIHRIIPPSQLPDIKFEIACDVQNPLYGPQGAACIYAPQKGASPQEVKRLDEGLRHFAKLIRPGIADIPGTGAAGGIAAGLMPFWEVRLEKGIGMVMHTSGIHGIISQASLVITGEGRIDQQTLYGKVVSEIAALAHRQGIPAIAFCGASTAAHNDIDSLQLRSVQVITPPNMPIEQAMTHAGDLLTEKVRAYFETRGQDR